MKEFNDLADFGHDEISELLALAERLRTSPEPTALQGKVLSMLFLSPSLRTMASFQAAMTRLGGGVLCDIAGDVHPRPGIAAGHRDGRRGRGARS